ncbi:hypothetical protein DAERI_020254 [Deinococcus aerius]|uniref:Uncharacterized protein n=2 Tax=Deinococcus TaxID=1298 RepID=A0A2I9DQV8_9DEIO|nr:MULTISPECIES: hypothetical protein [Deinococcus]MBB5293882.1 hypothetical protein [Deinococcus metallilatus]QBY07172.1 hypothetical protein E5F05_04100 [Deinococcus metallilatus]RXJ14644.1 hypothetical protein ERJ73_02830 [Deinococcus metallilatus]TLK30764.1 hypothetical protein FCS05_03145 [Deinococcus metallilatus]GBF04657.1 hypothetical protein DAERI_020254 [Deinococcus aerius]
METPGVWTRVRAFTRGERDAETLYAYRQAGTQVHPLLDAAERRRFDLTLSGTSPFAVKRHVGLELACAWNAFALQTLADKMLEADEAADPSTVGFVPPVTFDQVNAYYAEVGRWLGYASEAEHDPAFELPARTLPAKLPKWSPVEPCPRPHLDAMIAALDAMRLHAEAAMHNLEKTTPEADAPKLARLRGQFEGALSKANYASGMYRPGASLALHEQIEEHAKGAIEGLYRVGQLIGYPALLTEGGRSASPRKGEAPLLHTALPGEPGFDRWAMTDPNSVAFLRKDPDAGRVIDEMWALDPDPAASVALWHEIRRAVETGGAVVAKNAQGRPLGFYFCTPYCAIYEARRPLVLGETPVRKGQRFTFERAAEGVRVGYPFKREIVVGNFQTGAAIDYCDPDQPPPHDE